MMEIESIMKTKIIILGTKIKTRKKLMKEIKKI